MRISEETDREAGKAAERLKVSKADALSLAAEIGFKHLEAIGYDIAGAVLRQSPLKPRAAKGRQTPKRG